MSHGIYSALSGAIAQTVALETTATNLANTQTGGFRAVRPVFHEVMARESGRGHPAHFSVVRRTTVDMTPGSVKSTGRALDLALPEDAFLAVTTPAGERYTRAASLEVSVDGALITKLGREQVVDENGQPIQVGIGTEVTVGKDGAVIADGEPAGFVRVVTFDDPTRMIYEGGTLVAPDVGAGAPIPNTAPLQVGHVEESNATPVRAMTDLMMATRMFEAMEQAIGTFRDVDRALVTTVPRV